MQVVVMAMQQPNTAAVSVTQRRVDSNTPERTGRKQQVVSMLVIRKRERMG
jgi:hypothetical protein